jgi:hypothetical protein
VLSHRNAPRFIFRKAPTAAPTVHFDAVRFMKTTDETNDRKPTPVEARQLFTAEDSLNRELDRERQRRYRNCEPDLEYVQAEFEKLCRSEIAASIAAAIPSTKLRPK